MPYITETELSNLQQKIDLQEYRIKELIKACKLLLPFIERYVPKENSFAYECQEKARQIIATTEGGK